MVMTVRNKRTTQEQHKQRLVAWLGHQSQTHAIEKQNEKRSKEMTGQGKTSAIKCHKRCPFYPTVDCRCYIQVVAPRR